MLLALTCLVIGVPLYWFESTRLQYFNVDWNIAFYPAARLLVKGLNPYSVVRFHNPIWALIPLIPFVLLGKNLGGLFLFFFNLFTYAFVGYRFTRKPVALLAMLLSPLVFYNLFLGNIDSLVLWGLLLPPPIGLFFAMTKPQIGIGLVLYIAYTTWRDAGWRRLLFIFAPVTIALAISFLIFGNWMINSSENVLDAYWNFSLFPWSLPFGLLLLGIAIRNRNIQTSVSASPFLTPYLSVGSWSVVLMGLIDNNLLMVGVVFGLWLLYVINAILR